MANEKRLIAYDPITFESFTRHATKHIDPYYDPYGEGFTDAVDSIEGWLKNNTVDAVEVVHGYWIDSHSVDHIGRIIEHSIDCSVCDSVFKDDSRAVVKHWKEQFKVCPFCGAIMDGDGNV